jgi:hypothetical protein
MEKRGGRSENTRGGRFVHTFNPVEARDLQVCSLKPNDANQLGGQMAVAELEVYEQPQARAATKKLSIQQIQKVTS